MRHHAFAAAMGIVTAALLAPSSPSQAASADPTGYWMKPDAERESKIQVFKCGKSKTLLCAKIAWLKDPHDSRGQLLHDIRNEDPSKRGRSIVGLMIFSGLAPSAPSTWTGQIYNPEDGHTYSATLTVVSRRQIRLRGCKAWLLCGEKQWLRTAAPEELKPAAPAEGAEQIEASAEPTTPTSEPTVKPAAAVAEARPAEATPAAPAAPQAEMQATAEPKAAVEPQVMATPVSLVTQQGAAPAAPAEYKARRGYGFLKVSTGSDTAARLSGENVSSMFVMTEPIATKASPVSTDTATATAAVQSDEAVPAPKPKAKPKPVVAAAAPKPAPKPATAKPASQAAPAPQDTAEAEEDDAANADTAEAAMDEPVPLTRRQRRLLRRQQRGEQETFLPWLH
jgi:uncharacterized protein (DUF2147 family)